MHLAGERLALDPGGALYWPSRKLLVLADLHLEKGSHFAARGQMLPPFDTRETLERLGLLLRRYRVESLVFLGDSFHDAQGARRLHPADRASLTGLLEGREATWVLGNHDPVAPEGLPGQAVEELRLGAITLRHEGVPGPQAGFEISGHFHPKASIATRGGPVERPCFLADAKRLLLPAFGAYTGGLSVTAPAIAALFPRGGRAFLLGQERLYSTATGPLRQIPRAAPAAPPPALTRHGGGAAHNQTGGGAALSQTGGGAALNPTGGGSLGQHGGAAPAGRPPLGKRRPGPISAP
ncbi:ligase-associated DNA damage response endonuclease PdeM [Roseomonas sp. GC11]|uniref:ligase-associated DNA damage response endonuclease PdeM n=1 Tax=Roseomonas sp. GC11 TaxID=2950546 RepID=UPI00272ED144|nr:ligase-associated DNA damage response endonuclease PdeM [Roseomonas sp. GC11]